MGKYCFIGTNTCGCRVAGVVDDPTHTAEVNETIAEWVREGRTVTRETITDEPWVLQRCTHRGEKGNNPPKGCGLIEKLTGTQGYCECGRWRYEAIVGTQKERRADFAGRAARHFAGLE